MSRPYLFSKQAVEPLVFMAKEKTILKQVKREKDIVYGAQAVRKQIGMFSRPTQDYDVYSRRPQTSARRLEKSLDRQAGGNFYYSKPAEHPGTYKVKYVGVDRKPNTRDDISVADFTKPNRPIKYRVINRIRYAQLSETLKDKQRALKSKKYAFRHHFTCHPYSMSSHHCLSNYRHHRTNTT